MTQLTVVAGHVDRLLAVLLFVLAYIQLLELHFLVSLSSSVRRVVSSLSLYSLSSVSAASVAVYRLVSSAAE